MQKLALQNAARTAQRALPTTPLRRAHEVTLGLFVASGSVNWNLQFKLKVPPRPLVIRNGFSNALSVGEKEASPLVL